MILREMLFAVVCSAIGALTVAAAVGLLAPAPSCWPEHRARPMLEGWKHGG